jgi:DnaK suppressor protein
VKAKKVLVKSKKAEPKKTEPKKSTAVKPALSKAAPSKAAVARSALIRAAPSKVAPAKPALSKAALIRAGQSKVAPAKPALTKAAPARSGAKKAAPAAAAAKKPTKKETDVTRLEVKSRIPHIDDKTLQAIIDKLEDMRGESLQIVNQHRNAETRPWESGSDVGDDLDQASNEREREFSLIMRQRHLRRLQQIDEAFERIEDGTYGYCEATDEPINPRRLMIMPLARFSLEYQEQQEKMMGRASDDDTFVDQEDSFDSEE